MGTRCPFCHKNLWVMIDEAWQYPVTFCTCGQYEVNPNVRKHDSS